MMLERMDEMTVTRRKAPVRNPGRFLNVSFPPRRREGREILRRPKKGEGAGTGAGPPALKYDFRMVLFFPETPDFGDNGFRDPKQRLLVADAKGCQHGNLLIERRCNLGEGEKEVMSRLLDQ